MPAASVRRVARALAGATTLALAGWLVVPMVAGAPGSGVVVITGTDAAPAHDEIARHVREQGLAVEVDTTTDPCDLAAVQAIADEHRTVVVAGPGTSDRCLASSGWPLQDVTVVALESPSAEGAVDATPLVPPGAPARSGCQWWEPMPPAAAVATCEPDGSITVRDANGSLTVAGRDRLGRVVAGALT